MKPVYEQKLDQYINELKEGAEYIGEDGEMVCAATTARGALRKFRQRVKEDIGEEEVEDYTLQNVGIAWLILPITDGELTQDGEPVSWFVSYNKPHENRPSREVYTYRI